MFTGFSGNPRKRQPRKKAPPQVSVRAIAHVFFFLPGPGIHWKLRPADAGEAEDGAGVVGEAHDAKEKGLVAPSDKGELDLCPCLKSCFSKRSG